MTVAATATRSMRIANETPLTGSHAFSAELGQQINAEIPAATAAHPVMIGGFAKSDLLGLLLTCNRAVTARLYGLNFGGMQVDNFTVAGNLVLGVPGELTITGDVTGWLRSGDLLWIVGATTQQHDGVATVMDVAVAAGLSTVGVSKDLCVINAAVVEVFDVIEAGIVGTTFATKFEPLGPEHLLLGAAGNEFLAAGPPGVITTNGDFSYLQAGDQILIQGATTHGNDQIYTVVTAVYAAPDTTITVVEAVANVEAAAAGTTFQVVRTCLLARIAANVPFVWTLVDQAIGATSAAFYPDSMGAPCPILEDITACTVDNADALTADFQARIVTVRP